MGQIVIDDIIIDITFKKIKHIRLSVHPPDGHVRISAPFRVDMETVREFAVSRLMWIKKHKETIKNHEIRKPDSYVTGETHWFLGREYFLDVTEIKSTPTVVLKDDVINLVIRPKTSLEKRKDILDGWYRTHLKEIIESTADKWERRIGVKASELRIKKMKTRWGSCNIRAKRIWLSLELAKKPLECIEFIIVHELIHLLERNHNKRFYSLMDRFLPDWKIQRDILNNNKGKTY